MPNIQLFAPIDRKSADTILFFEESRVFIVPLFFQKLLINAELSLCSVPYQNSVNVLLGDSKSGGLFILRRLNCRFLFLMAREQGVTEELKASDQMKWVGLMNNIKAAAEEMALAEIVYAN